MKKTLEDEEYTLEHIDANGKKLNVTTKIQAHLKSVRQS